MKRWSLLLAFVFTFAVTNGVLSASPEDRAATAQMQIDGLNNGINLKKVAAQTLRRDIGSIEKQIATLERQKASRPQSSAEYTRDIAAENASREAMQAKLSKVEQEIADSERAKEVREQELRTAQAAKTRATANAPESEDLETALGRKGRKRE